MSRAFVKEPDSEQADPGIIERPQSVYPNYITVAGLVHLKSALEDLRDQRRELKSREGNLSVKDRLPVLEAATRYLEKRIQCAIPVDVSAQTGSQIRFGATVNLVDDKEQCYTFRIVGEDEADVDHGMISWVSPLAREMIGKQAGACLTWKRPAGDLELEITGFFYQ